MHVGCLAQGPTVPLQHFSFPRMIIPEGSCQVGLLWGRQCINTQPAPGVLLHVPSMCIGHGALKAGGELQDATRLWVLGGNQPSGMMQTQPIGIMAAQHLAGSGSTRWVEPRCPNLASSESWADPTLLP